MDEEAIDEIAYDIFQDAEGRVLVVSSYRGRHDRGAQGWQGPTQAADSPRHLIDTGGRRNLHNWVFEGIAPRAFQWRQSAQPDLRGPIADAQLVDAPSSIPGRIARKAAAETEDMTWGWESRGITVDDTPQMAARFECPDSHRPAHHWGLLYETQTADTEFALIVTLRAKATQDFDVYGRIAYADQIAEVTDAYGPQEGLLYLLANSVFDEVSPSLQGSIAF